jgi:hypothetical protein
LPAMRAAANGRVQDVCLALLRDNSTVHRQEIVRPFLEKERKGGWTWFESFSGTAATRY